MATVITEECINCGACEPECPNTAIYQAGVEYDWQGKKHPAVSADIFYIVPEKCTECVGFFDHEACAAVCPVDCCIPDPARPETESLLLERARELHPDKLFSPDAPSRFRKGSAASGDAAAPSGSEANVQLTAPTSSTSAQQAAGRAEPDSGGAGSTVLRAGANQASASSSAPIGLDGASPASSRPFAEDLRSADPTSYEVPITCRSCNGRYAVAFRFLSPGLVLRCPHCNVSFAPSRRLYTAVQTRLARFVDLVDAEILRHKRALESEQSVFDENVIDIHESTERDILRLIEELTEPPKRSVFG